MTQNLTVAIHGGSRLRRDVTAARLLNAGVNVLSTGWAADDAAPMPQSLSVKVIWVLATADVADQMTALTRVLQADQRVALEGPILSGGAAALELAAAGRLTWIAEDANWQEVMQCIERLHTGAVAPSPQILAAGLRQLRVRQSPHNGHFAVSPLTHQEQKVAGLLRDGLLNKQIARRLGIPLGTVKSHVHRLMHKSAVRSRRKLQQPAISCSGIA